MTVIGSSPASGDLQRFPDPGTDGDVMDEVVRLIFSAASVVAVTSDGLDSRPQASPILSDVTLVDAGETAA